MRVEVERAWEALVEELRSKAPERADWFGFAAGTLSIAAAPTSLGEALEPGWIEGLSLFELEEL